MNPGGFCRFEVIEFFSGNPPPRSPSFNKGGGGFLGEGLAPLLNTRWFKSLSGRLKSPLISFHKKERLKRWLKSPCVSFHQEGGLDIPL